MAVSRMSGIGSLAALALLGMARAAGAASPYDGSWVTTVSCAAARDALGYSFRFVSTVTDGAIHGQRGEPGKPSSFQIDGRLGPDGSGRLYVKGYTGSKEFVPGRDTPRGTDYGYDVDARFEADHGTGVRVEGRPCTLVFERQ
jgi:hypothetical protein